MNKRSVAVCLAVFLFGPLLFAQVQIGPGVQIGGSGSGVAGSNQQVQINNGGAQGAVPVTIDSSGNIFAGASGSGTITAQMRDNGGEKCNVLVFGADPTGAHPSDSAVAQAFSTCQGKPVYFPDVLGLGGTYLLNSTESIISTVIGTPGPKMYGDGMGRSTIVCGAPFTATNGACFSFVGVDPTHAGTYADGGWVHDLTITTSGSPSNLAGFYMLGQWRFKFEHVQIKGMTGDAAYYPLRTDIPNGPDSYASDFNYFIADDIEANGGYGINQECGLCASNMFFIGNRILQNAKDGIVIGGHNAHVIASNNIAENGSGFAGNLSGNISSCVGGGIVVKRVQTSVIGVVIKGNGDFDSNCLYQIDLQAVDGFDISDNRFISHDDASQVYSSTKANVPVVDVRVGVASGSAVLDGNIKNNYIRSDGTGVGGASSLTAFQINKSQASGIDLTNNALNTLGNTSGLTAYGTDGGGLITCASLTSGTPNCAIQQGGYYVATPILSVPSGYGCTGTPSATLTANAITSINLSGVTGCTSTPPFLQISAAAYPASNAVNVNIRDNTSGTVSGPAVQSMNAINLPIGTAQVGLYQTGTTILQREPTGTIAQRFGVVHAWNDNADYQAGCLDYSGSVFKVGNCHAGTGVTSLTWLVGDTGLVLAPDGTARFSLVGTTMVCSTAGACTIGTSANPIGDVSIGGTAGNFIDFITSGLTTHRQLTVQDASGTIALTSQLTHVRAGTWTISTGTTVAVTFSPALSVAPNNCSVMASSDPTAVGAMWPTSLSTTGFTVNIHTAAAISGTYSCTVTNSN